MATDLNPLYTKTPGTVQADAAPAAAASTAGATTSNATAAKAASTDATASTAGSKDAQAFNATAAGYKASTQGVSPDAMADVQAARITSQDSPMMQRAREQGMLTAGRRGLQNSSIAVGAAQGAMVDRAAPLALQNAQAAQQQALANQAATNRASEVSAGFEQQAEIQRAGLETGVSQFNTDAANRAEALNAQLSTDVAKFNAASENEASKLNAQLETAVSQGNEAAANAARQQLAELETRVNAQNAEFQQQTELTNAAAENQMRQAVMTQNSELTRQYTAGEQAKDLATIQGEYNQLISTNQAAGALYGSYFDSISQAMANKDIPPDRLAQYVNVQQSMLQNGLEMIDQMNKLNLDTAMPGTTSTGTGSTSTITPGAEPVSAPAPAPVAEPAPTPNQWTNPYYPRSGGSIRGVT